MDNERLSERLGALSRRHFSALPQISEWPESLAAEAWCYPPELISLAGTAAFEELSEASRKRLALLELTNFFSLNVHGERRLLAGLALHLYGPAFQPYQRYLHHFLDEENKHLECFASFCSRYAGKVYRDRRISLERECSPGEAAFCFFIKVLIFEEIVDFFNRRLAADERLPPIVRQINRMHHEDEARHLSFGRAVVFDLFQRYGGEWSDETHAFLRRYLEEYIEATLREFCNADVYRDAGLIPLGTAKEFQLARQLTEQAFASSGRTFAEAARGAWAQLRRLGLCDPCAAPAADRVSDAVEESRAPHG